MFLYNFVKKHNVTKRTFVGYFTGLAVIFYFLFCTIFGPKGLLEYYNLEAKIAQKEIIKKALSSKVNDQQDMVDGMSADSLDIDLVDEQARKVLGYSGKNEVVIYQKEESSKKETQTNKEK